LGLGSELPLAPLVMAAAANCGVRKLRLLPTQAALLKIVSLYLAEFHQRRNVEEWFKCHSDFGIALLLVALNIKLCMLLEGDHKGLIPLEFVLQHEDVHRATLLFQQRHNFVS
jgi:hypothetical protein